MPDDRNAEDFRNEGGKPAWALPREGLVIILRLVGEKRPGELAGLFACLLF